MITAHLAKHSLYAAQAAHISRRRRFGLWARAYSLSPLPGGDGHGRRAAGPGPSYLPRRGSPTGAGGAQT